MRRKLLPSLFSLYQQKKLPEKFFILGFARREMADDNFREEMRGKLASQGLTLQGWEGFAQNLYYQQGLFGEEEGYEELRKRLEAFDKEVGACIARFFYLATPPDNYETILNFLESTGLSEGCGHQSSSWTRVIIEKPFGRDLETARALDKKLAREFSEKQIFRVDHYLGKETVQNIITFRFANGIFEPIWNRDYIDHVQITWAEKGGVEGRGKFFDGVGLLRDVGQNHLMQLIAAVAMEQPKSFAKEDVRDARAAAIKTVHCIETAEVAKSVVSGQYEEYRKEKDVNRDSTTETFVAMKLFIDTPRFQGVPFYIRAGKKMARETAEISIVFIQTCHILFKEFGCPEEGNVLTIRIQPDEGISMRVIAKKPGEEVSLGTVNMKFSYQEEFGNKGADAYEKLLLDIFSGDQMLFNRSDELESSWEFITKILQGWKNQESRIINYRSGTWGPKEAQELIEKDGRKWL